MRKFIISVLALTVSVCSLSSFADYELSYSGIVDNPLLTEFIKNASKNEESELMYPPEKHPYIFVNENYINQLKTNKGDEVYKQAYTYQLSLAKKELPPQPKDGILQSSISNQLVARAFMYLMGEFDENHAKETVKYAIEYIKNAKTQQTYSISIYKDYGENAIQCGAFVYDWCYDVMTPSQRSEIAEAVRNLIYSTDQPCRPDNIATAWSDLNGKSVGLPLQYMSIAVSAFYDVYPDMYELVMQKVQGTMAEASRRYGIAGALTDGSIAYTREDYTYIVQILFQRMGHDITQKYGNQLPAGYLMLYTRLPNGGYIKYGDHSPGPGYIYGEYYDSGEVANNMGLLNVMYDDPYLKHFYMRENSGASKMIDLLCKKGYHEALVPDDLPLTFEASEPRTMLIAKTSMQEGLDSPQVTAVLNMNNRRSGDHDHADHGTFQLYYKGPLTMPGGSYYGEDWGKSHWRNYYTRTVSKNGLLVYNPNEIYSYGNKVAEANDGGQLMAKNNKNEYVIGDLEEHFSKEKLVTVTEGTYVGPNEKTPAFSYVKGDLTNAYSKTKMESYNRSMVFMDTFNETYPGVLLVFDRVSSKKASYEKTWLLQAVAEPKIEGNKITIINSESNPLAGGKLVNTVLYPQAVEIEKVGGIGVYIAEGKQWPIDADSPASVVPVDTMNASGWRAEVKPLKSQTDDVFLNAMFVADADTAAPDLEMKRVEDELFMGVVTLDRQVMFSKSGKAISSEFKVKVEDNNLGGNMLVLLCDVAKGKWHVTGNGVDMVLCSEEGDNAFAMEVKSGTYTLTPADDTAEVTKINWQEAKKEKIGDFSIEVDGVYQYLRDETKLVDGVAYIPESFINYSTDAKAVRNGNSLIITCPDDKILTLTAASNTYTVEANGNVLTKNCANAPFIDENGVFYWNYSDSIGTTMYLNCGYIKSAKSLSITKKPILTYTDEYGVVQTIGKLNGVDESKVVWPISVYCSSNGDGYGPEHLTDRNLGTRWSSIQGDEEWACFYLGDDAVEMSAVQIAFYNGDKRNWKFDIQISDDGENWNTVLKDKKSGGNSLDVETFNLPEGTKARYIRYLGHGEEVTNTFNNSLTQFIIINE